MEWRSWQPPDVVTSGRVAVRLTFAISGLVVLDLFIQDRLVGPLAVLALASVIGTGIVGSRINWEAVADRPVGTLLPYLWTSTGLIGWTVYVGAVGAPMGQRMLLVLAIAVVASGVGYPLRGQLAMYGLTAAALPVGLLWADPDVPPEVLVLELGLLAILAGIIIVVAGHLRRARRNAAEMRIRAERRSHLLQAVANLARLDPAAAMEAAVDELLGLGFDAAALNEFEDGRLHPRAHRGFRVDRPPQALPSDEGLAGAAFTENRTIVVDDYQSHPAALSRRPDVGAVVTTPIRVDGRPVGVALAARSAPGPVPPLLVEVLETIAIQSGRVLTNAHRFEAERRTGQRLTELNQMKTELLQSVSSELRAPLTVVSGVAETMCSRPQLLDTDPTMLERLIANTDRLSTMIYDLLDFSRLRSGRYELVGTTVDLAELARQVARPGVSIDATGTATVVVDEQLITRALSHLLAPSDRVFRPLQVLLDAEDGDGVTVRICLRRRDRSQASGAIGVSLAAEILASHGAAIEVEDSGGDDLEIRFVLRSLQDPVPRMLDEVAG